jgi:hypothetical protein
MKADVTGLNQETRFPGWTRTRLPKGPGADAVGIRGYSHEAVGCLQPTLPPARMAAAMQDADHDCSVAVNEEKDPKGKSVQ